MGLAPQGKAGNPRLCPEPRLLLLDILRERSGAKAKQSQTQLSGLVRTSLRERSEFCLPYAAASSKAANPSAVLHRTSLYHHHIANNNNNNLAGKSLLVLCWASPAALCCLGRFVFRPSLRADVPSLCLSLRGGFRED